MSEASVTERDRWDEFRDEFVLYWRQYADKGFFFLLLAAWLALFQFLGNATYGYVDTPSLYGWLWGVYTASTVEGGVLAKLSNSEDGYCVLIPFIVAALFWRDRDVFVKVERRLWWPGLLLLGGAMMLHLAGYLVQQPRVSTVALLAGVYALVGLTWGWRFVAAAFFPYVLLLFCVPLGGLADVITVPLRQVSTDISVWVVRELLGIPVIQQGVQIIDPKGGYNYEVAAACSGIRSLITLFALTTIYGFVTFSRFWKRGLMVALALPLALIGNIVRLVAIVIAAEAFGQRAGEFVHDWFGFVTFALALAVMFLFGHWLREPEPPGPAAMPQSA